MRITSYIVPSVGTDPTNGDTIMRSNRRAAAIPVSPVDVVTGKVPDVDRPIITSEVPTADGYFAVPTIGGGTIGSAKWCDEYRFTAVCMHPVSRALMDRKQQDPKASWVLVPDGYGGAVATTVDEAYARGLREFPDWHPADWRERLPESLRREFGLDRQGGSRREDVAE